SRPDSLFCLGGEEQLAKYSGYNSTLSTVFRVTFSPIRRVKVEQAGDCCHVFTGYFCRFCACAVVIVKVQPDINRLRIAVHFITGNSRKYSSLPVFRFTALQQSSPQIITTPSGIATTGSGLIKHFRGVYCKEGERLKYLATVPD
ncbi:hypothetical protein AVEN_188453-1, partial [Araneus ventricosus]